MSQYKFVYTFSKKKPNTKSIENKTEEKSVTSVKSVTPKKYTRPKKPRCYT